MLQPLLLGKDEAKTPAAFLAACSLIGQRHNSISGAMSGPLDNFGRVSTNSFSGRFGSDNRKSRVRKFQ